MAGEECIIRLAGPQDYAGILAITDDMYGGIDYIPIMLRQFLHGPHQVWVCEIEGQIVSIVRGKTWKLKYFLTSANL